MLGVCKRCRVSLHFFCTVNQYPLDHLLGEINKNLSLLCSVAFEKSNYTCTPFLGFIRRVLISYTFDNRTLT